MDDPAYQSISDSCANLCSNSIHEPFVLYVLNRPSGFWVRVNDTLSDFSLEEIDIKGLDGDLYVTWLNTPDFPSGYACLLFFMPREVWSFVAVYNTAQLREKRAIS